MINDGEDGFLGINDDKVSVCPGFLTETTCESRRIQTHLKAEGEGAQDLISQPSGHQHYVQ